MRSLAVLVFSLVCFGQSTEEAFRKYWSAPSPTAAAKAASDIVKSGVSFEEAWRRLKAGRTYAPAKSGVERFTQATGRFSEHFYSVNIPENYDPSKKYQLRFQLHGGVGRRSDNKPRGTGEIGTLAGAEQFYVLPYSWDESPWWGEDQVENLVGIADAVRRKYNIDENRIVVSGVSDGGTGAYYLAMRETTPFAGFLPLNGYIMVISNSEIDDGRVYPNNLRNKPLFVVNGGLDRLYPLSATEPYTRHLMRGGVTIDYHPQPNGEHNTRWWPEVKDDFESFVTSHAREPHPASITWETSGKSHTRAHWLVIDALGAAAGESRSLPDLNVWRGPETLFTRAASSGRVDISRKGNLIEASTRNVNAFTVLLSPDVFDFDQPVRVVANGREVFNGRVTRDVKTLLKWAAKDNDRSMLYGAEIAVKLLK